MLALGNTSPTRDLPLPNPEASDLPQHIAIIMDGNRRWAGARGLPKAAGHAVGARRVRAIVQACGERGIPALTAAPLGMGVSMLCFMPGGMSFEDYFRLEGHPRQEQFARFIAGLSPAMLQRNYLVVPEAVNFAERRGPSTAMACDLCAGVMGVSVLKVLLGRGAIKPAPWAMQFDAYRQSLKFTWRPWGNANPLQQLLLMMIRPRLRGARGVDRSSEAEQANR